MLKTERKRLKTLLSIVLVFTLAFPAMTGMAAAETNANQLYITVDGGNTAYDDIKKLPGNCVGDIRFYYPDDTGVLITVEGEAGLEFPQKVGSFSYKGSNVWEWDNTDATPGVYQIKFIKDFGTTALHAIPSYATRLFEVMQQEGIDPRKDTRLTTLIIGAEPHSEEQRKKIEEMLGVKAYNSFGMSEMCGPGVAFECKEQNGLHIWEDYYIVEIVDPDTLEPVPDGEFGELVLTTINREAMPLLRYRTRDLTRVLPGECSCGRQHKRLDRMRGRSDDMIILKGVNIFPIQIETILMQFKELGTNYLITLENDDNNDIMIVEVEVNPIAVDDFAQLTSLQKEITRRLKDEILVTPKVRLVPNGNLPQSEGKAVRVKDNRKTLYNK